MPTLDTVALERMATAYFAHGEPSLAELAAPYSIEDLIQSFTNLRQSMARLLKGLTENQITYSPDSNTYSLSEVVSHLVAAQGDTYNAFLDIASSTRPHIDPVPRGPGAGAEKGLSGAILQERLQKATDDLLEVLHHTYSPTNERLADHPQFGKINHKGWMLFQLVHDLDHLKQAQVLRRSVGFPPKSS